MLKQSITERQREREAQCSERIFFQGAWWHPKEDELPNGEFEESLTLCTCAMKAKGSTRHIRCDYDFIKLLHEDYGICEYDLTKAFIGIPSVPKKQAIALCEWATQAHEEPWEAGRALKLWAKRHGKGQYHPQLLDDGGEAA